MGNRYLKVILALLLSTLFCGWVSAQDIIVKTDGTIMRATVDEINASYIVYHDYGKADAPKQRLNVSDISKIQFVDGLEQTFTIAAAPPSASYPSSQSSGPYTPQYVFTYGKMSSSRGDLVLAGDRLTKDQIIALLGQDQYDIYRSGARKRHLGKTFLGVGIPLLATGGLFLMSAIVVVGTSDASDYQKNNGLRERVGVALIGSTLVTAGGATMLGIGISSLKQGKRQINSVVENYNNRVPGYAYTLEAGLTPSGGLGLTLSF